jgi:hypothetical protein
MKKVQNNKSVIVLSTEDFKSMGKWGKGWETSYHNGNELVEGFCMGTMYYHSEWDFGFQIVETNKGNYKVSFSSSWVYNILVGEFPISECIKEGFTDEETNKEFLRWLRNGIEKTYNDYSLPIYESSKQYI